MTSSSTATSTATATPRLLFLDNLRYLVVLFVIFFHVSAGYSGLPEYYMETNSGGFFQILRNIIGPIPRMAVLFFVAGFFALSSLQRRGVSDFWRRKGQRLGAPWLLCILFLGPLMPYLGYYSQSFNGLDSASYADFWSLFIASGFDLERWITPVVFTPNTQFHQMHYWFTSMLLQFYAVMSLAYIAWEKWGPASGAKDKGDRPRPSFTKVMLLAALGMAVLKALSVSLDWPHGTLLFFIKFSPTEAVTYGGFFLLGIYARHCGWFIDGQVPGWRTALLLLGMLAACGGSAAGLYFLGEDLVPQQVLFLIGFLGEALMVVFFLVLAIGLAHRYMNRPSTLNAKLAANSYYVYLVHYPLILLFRLPLLTWDGPVWIKFAVVLSAASLGSYLLSEYLIRSHRRWAAAALVGLHVSLFTFGLPHSSYSHQLLDRQGELQEIVPTRRPEQIVEAPPAGFDIWSQATPVVRLSWQQGALYFVTPAQGLQVLPLSGSPTVLDAGFKSTGLCPLPGGRLAAVDSTGQIVALDARGATQETLVDSGAVDGTPRYLVSDEHGGLYFTVAPSDSGQGAVYYRDADGHTAVAFRPEAAIEPHGLALSATGDRLFFNAAGDPILRSLDIAPNGKVSGPQPFAELFLADGRYGRQDLDTSVDARASGMATDVMGHLYVSTRFGLQVFSPQGRLLGLVHFPDVPLSFNPKWPRQCVFGGSNMSTLYVTCDDEVYAVETRSPGFILPGG